MLCVSSNLGHRCLTGASSCILAFPTIIFLCSHLFLEDQGGSGDREAKVQRSGGSGHSPRSSSSSSAGTKQLAMLGSKQEWTAEGRAPVGQVPPSAPLGHSDGNLGVLR